QADAPVGWIIERCAIPGIPRGRPTDGPVEATCAGGGQGRVAAQAGEAGHALRAHDLQAREGYARAVCLERRRQAVVSAPVVLITGHGGAPGLSARVVGLDRGLALRVPLQRAIVDTMRRAERRHHVAWAIHEVRLVV